MIAFLRSWAEHKVENNSLPADVFSVPVMSQIGLGKPGGRQAFNPWHSAYSSLLSNDLEQKRFVK